MPAVPASLNLLPELVCDACLQDISMQNGVSAVPTFHMYNNSGQKVEEVSGGNPYALKAWCEQNNKSASFQGTGHTLSGEA